MAKNDLLAHKQELRRNQELSIDIDLAKAHARACVIETTSQPRLDC